jgi:phospho-N-acetylmuramoyl-pentapeptide-transferase
MLLYIFIKFNIIGENISGYLEHKKNLKNTPTMGGFLFMSPFIITICIYFKFPMLLYFFIFSYINILLYNYKKNIFKGTVLLYILLALYLYYVSFLNFNIYFSVIFFTILGFFIGALDDIQKVQDKTGLSDKIIFLIEIIIGFFLITHICYLFSGEIFITKFFSLNLSYFSFFPLIFLFLSMINAVAITDGFNGGLAMNIFFIFGALTQLSCAHKFFIYVFLINLIPFIYFNLRGKIFMGNVGSFSIGMFYLAYMFYAHKEFFIPILGIFFVIEICSCVLQIFFRKKYNKKLFKFAPIHHHFELSGYTNIKILLGSIFVTSIGIFGYIVINNI